MQAPWAVARSCGDEKQIRTSSIAAGIAASVNRVSLIPLEHLQITEDTLVLYFSPGRFVKEIFAV